MRIGLHDGLVETVTGKTLWLSAGRTRTDETNAGSLPAFLFWGPQMQSIHLVMVWDGGEYGNAAFIKDSELDPNIHTTIATISQISLARKLAAELTDIANQIEETVNV